LAKGVYIVKLELVNGSWGFTSSDPQSFKFIVQ
jgi:hypothetical protein